MHAAESKRAKWPTGFFVVCTKKLKKKCKLKFCSMFLLIRKPRGNVQPSPLRKSARRALVSETSIWETPLVDYSVGTCRLFVCRFVN